MPRIIWDSEEKKALEWSIANDKLVAEPNGAKLKRADKKEPIDYYTGSNGFAVNLSHSFIKIGDKVLAMAGQGKYLGKGGFGKVKLAEDESGHLYALKIGHNRGDISGVEKYILKDLRLYQGDAKRVDQPKEMVLLHYLGVDLFNFQFENDKQRVFALFSAANELNKLHSGELSRYGLAYLHRDIKPKNITFDGKKSFFIDFGLAKRVVDGVWGGEYQGVPNHAVSGTDGYISPEILNKRIYSYKSDIYALGVTFQKILSENSPLRALAGQMRSKHSICRPSLDLVKISFLAEIHRKSDENLEKALREYNCIVKDSKSAKDIFFTLLEQSENSLFVQSCNSLERCFYDEKSAHLHKNSFTFEHWQALKENFDLREVAIVFHCAAIKISQSDWEQLKDSSILQEAIIALYRSDIKLAQGDWEQLKDTSNLQKAVHTVYSSGQKLTERWEVLKDSSHFQAALTAAYDYLNNNEFSWNKTKGQTETFIQKLLDLEDKSLDSVKAEMRHWVKGYGVFGQSSKLHDLSRVRFAHQSGLFRDHFVDSTVVTPFFDMSKTDRKKEKQAILDFLPS
ncbi:protein kinase domain-containing protein [Piscirickettsia salmonis]|uniref:protein kinase domain-containing protein n=1 Tax=Piscirickettsia salmonis TaxID=1238 RepID=UPI003EB88875